MKRRQAVDPERPPERLWRFRYDDWRDEVTEAEASAYASPSYAAYRAYRAARVAWAEENGVTLAEMRKLIPPPVVVDRPRLVRHRGGDDAA